MTLTEQGIQNSTVIELEDSDASDVSGGENLMDDLREVLEKNSNFKGSFAYSSLLPEAPNPFLNIEGIGLIGLPLSEREAAVIIRHSSQAPYGHGDRTLVNPEVRDTWEISSSCVKFDNPTWEGFVQKVATTILCPELGVAQVASPPRVEFYKLLLYQTGSHFLPHQDTPKTDGMFATMIILLPSKYTGGQVHLSHGSEQKVFDFATDSYVNAAVLGWYTDVVHEVKPITSGYRLALSYNIIHTSTQVSRPVVTELNQSAEKLRNILRKWKHSVYDEFPGENYVVYVLDHKYSKEVGFSNLATIDAMTNRRPSLGNDGRPSGDQQQYLERTNNEIESAFDLCLAKAIPQWHEVTPSYYDKQSVSGRILQLLEVCLSKRKMASCEALLDLVKKHPGELCTKFETIYVPLVPPLLSLLKKTQTDFYYPPFSDFMRELIGNYLQHMVGTITHSSRRDHSVGCGCDVCKQLDAFIASPVIEQNFTLAKAKWQHLVSQVEGARDLLTATTPSYRAFRAPHQVMVRKTDKFLAVQKWEYRLREANAFLNSVGIETVQRLMGDR
ncbi:hypothetical protein AMATHDRAFT_7154 [Amanita thiersii Skay4041]|uniref:Prolyl 4-hydroxylase alpha subunit Fe(2+) 2OG dioxygenase domain-containing protein n=1 Tax=Amanita thiersii Skay4041 TaxID=703135 RepID=A0A2A9N8G3_9AGAR|nr:hypothetical protein AMATHDRAFT_7154 [Amanita thiersii Skay4041]